MNASASFQNFVKYILVEFLDSCIMAYFNDILIYLDPLCLFRIHVYRVLEALSRVTLHLKLERCVFYKEVKYLGMIIGRGGVKKDT